MKQKYQVIALLQKYFNEIDADLDFLKFKRVKAKKIMFKPGDPIESLYFIVSGDVRLSFHDKELMLPPEILIGDYQSFQKLSRRVTTLQVITTSSLIVVPIKYFKHIKDEVIKNYTFIKQMLYLQNQRADYIASHIFCFKQVYREQQIVADHGQNVIDFILVKSGLFTVRKYIGVSIIPKYNIEVEKQFSLVQVGEGQLVKQNLICNTPRGEIFICKHLHAKNFLDNFKQIETLFQNVYKKKQSRIERQKIIKNICQPNSEYVSSILPSVFVNSQRKTERIAPKFKKSRIKLKTEFDDNENQRFEKYSQNHFSIGYENNELCSSPTNLNFSLIPFIKIRRPTMPKTNRVTHEKIIKRILRNASAEKFQYEVSTPKIMYDDEDQIPEIFNSKFKKKMFLKPNNPFRHFKSKSMPVEQQLSKPLKQTSPEQSVPETKLSKVGKQILRIKK